MATKLYLRNTTTNGVTDTGDAVVYDLSLTAGAAVDTDTVGLTNGGTNIQWTQTNGGNSVAWISPIIRTAFTITTSDFSGWFAESNLNDNAGGRLRVYKYTPGVPTITELGGSPFDDGVEWTGSDAEYTWVADMTDTAFAVGDRILIRLFATNVGSMTVGTATFKFNAADAATGDSFFNVNETIVFTTTSSSSSSSTKSTSSSSSSSSSVSSSSSSSSKSTSSSSSSSSSSVSLTTSTTMALSWNNYLFVRGAGNFGERIRGQTYGH
jgi:hypothetical protein